METNIILTEQSDCPRGYTKVAKNVAIASKASGTHDMFVTSGGTYCIKPKSASPQPPNPNPNPNPNPRPPKPPKPNTPPNPTTPEDTKIEEVSFTVSDICVGGKILKKGMKGGIVKLLQNKLSVTETGIFDDKTVAGVELHQKQKDFIPSGQVDKETWQSIFEGTKHACTKNLKHPDIDYTEKIWTGESIIKRALTEQTANLTPLTTKDLSSDKKIEDDRLKLKQVIDTGCINTIRINDFPFVLDKGSNQPTLTRGGIYAIAGTINGKMAKLLPDNTVTQSEDGRTFTKIGKWECESFKIPESRSCSGSTYLTTAQRKFVEEYLTKNKGYQCDFPPIGEVSQGDWQKIDLCDLAPGLFSREKCGQFFFFTRVGKTGGTDNRFEAIENYLKKVGWTFEPPEFGKNVPTSTVGKYISKQDLGNVDPNRTIYRTSIPNPSDEQMISARELSDLITEKNQRPDKETCKNAIELLYKAGIEAPGRVQYFEYRQDEAIVREYAYRCYTSRTIKTSKNKTLGGVGYKLYRLASEAYGERGVRRFFLGGYGESTFTNENILSKTINKKLLEMKKMKDDAKDSETLLENKLKTMVSRIKDNLSGKL